MGKGCRAADLPPCPSLASPLFPSVFAYNTSGVVTLPSPLSPPHLRLFHLRPLIKFQAAAGGMEEGRRGIEDRRVNGKMHNYVERMEEWRLERRER